MVKEYLYLIKTYTCTNHRRRNRGGGLDQNYNSFFFFFYLTRFLISDKSSIQFASDATAIT